MKVISEKLSTKGRRVVTVELDTNEHIVAVRDDCYYRLSEPMDEVLPAHCINGATQVTWCPIEQRWAS